MVIVKISCGLGNQLFQYSVGRRLSLFNRTRLKLDISSYDNDSLRSYSLNHFNILAQIATPKEIAKYSGSRVYGRRDLILDNLERVGLFHRPVKFVEKDLSFNPDIFKPARKIYLEGWWATEKYFSDIENVIRKDLTLKNPLGKESLKLLSEIENTQSVSVHLRRGDKANDPATTYSFGTCSINYYKKAIQLILERTSPLHLFVFSDDLQWAHENLKLGLPTTYVGHNRDNGQDFEDLVLMSHCKYHVIANSTFSWWGAWLCNFQDKLVIAPKKWFNNLNYDTKDIIPSRWHKL